MNIWDLQEFALQKYDSILVGNKQKWRRLVEINHQKNMIWSAKMSKDAGGEGQESWFRTSSTTWSVVK